MEENMETKDKQKNYGLWIATFTIIIVSTAFLDRIFLNNSILDFIRLAL